MSVVVEVRDCHPQWLPEGGIVGRSEECAGVLRIVQQYGHAAGTGGREIDDNEVHLARPLEIADRHIDRLAGRRVGGRCQEAPRMRRILQQD